MYTDTHYDIVLHVHEHYTCTVHSATCTKCTCTCISGTSYYIDTYCSEGSLDQPAIVAILIHHHQYQ